MTRGGTASAASAPSSPPAAHSAAPGLPPAQPTPSRCPQTVGELCNSLSALAGNMVDKVCLGDDVMDDPNATLLSWGIKTGATLTVTFSRSPRFQTQHVSNAGDDASGSSDPTTLQRVFRTVEVPFRTAPFGLELEVRKGGQGGVCAASWPLCLLPGVHRCCAPQQRLGTSTQAVRMLGAFKYGLGGRGGGGQASPPCPPCRLSHTAIPCNRRMWDGVRARGLRRLPHPASCTLHRAPVYISYVWLSACVVLRERGGGGRPGHPADRPPGTPHAMSSSSPPCTSQSTPLPTA